MNHPLSFLTLIFGGLLLVLLSDQAVALLSVLASHCYTEQSQYVSCWKTEVSSFTVTMTDDIIDPKTTLSDQELILQLIKNCQETCIKEINLEREYFNAETKAEREHSKAVHSKIIGSLGSFAKAINRNHATQTQRISDLELKLETISFYQELQISNLKSFLHDRDAVVSHTTCTNCEKSFCPHCNVNTHIKTHHCSHLEQPTLQSNTLINASTPLTLYNTLMCF